MDQRNPPDEDPRDARQRLDIVSQKRSEELQGANEPQADGIAPRPGTSELQDPVARRMLIGGGIAIGLVLAARVKQVGQVEFYENIPDKLPDVVRAGLELPPS